MYVKTYWTLDYEHVGKTHLIIPDDETKCDLCTVLHEAKTKLKK